MSGDPIAFHIEQVGDYLVPVIHYPDGGRFRHAPCVCVDQAVSLATRGETRPLPHLGDSIPQACSLSDRAPGHGHTHGAAVRNARAAS